MRNNSDCYLRNREEASFLRFLKQLSITSEEDNNLQVKLIHESKMSICKMPKKSRCNKPYVYNSFQELAFFKNYHN